MPQPNPDFSRIVQAYRDRYGVDFLHMHKKAEKAMSFPEEEIDFLKGSDRIVTHRVSKERGRYDKGDVVATPWGDRYEVFDRSDLRSVDDSPYAGFLTPEQRKALLKKEIALLTLRRLEKKAQAITPEEIEAMARPHYPDSGSHGWNHIEDVLASARRMRKRELLKKELAALMYHDSSLLTGPRETHAEDSAEIARKELAGRFTKRQLADIANAIAHHRASYEGRRKSRLEDLVAAADRNIPNVDKSILRSYRYGLEHGMTKDEAVANTLQHMPDKYGTRGYAYRNIPKIYLDTYGDELAEAQRGFDAVTADKIRSLVKDAMSRDRIQAQYARHPQESLERLAARLAQKKWGKRDVAREDAAHAEEFGVTGEDKEYLDRYIIARIAEKHDRKAKLKQALMRALWEKGHNGESFDAALPARMARFRQYEDSPFGKYDNPLEQAKYDEWASKSDEDMDAEWEKYLKN